MLFSKSSIRALITLAMLSTLAMGEHSCSIVGYTFKCKKRLYICNTAGDGVPEPNCIGQGDISDGINYASDYNCGRFIGAIDAPDTFSFVCPNLRNLTTYSSVCADGTGLKCWGENECARQTCDSRTLLRGAEFLFQEGFEN